MQRCGSAETTLLSNTRPLEDLEEKAAACQTPGCRKMSEGWMRTHRTLYAATKVAVARGYITRQKLPDKSLWRVVETSDLKQSFQTSRNTHGHMGVKWEWPQRYGGPKRKTCFKGSSHLPIAGFHGSWLKFPLHCMNRPPLQLKCLKHRAGVNRQQRIWAVLLDTCRFHAQNYTTTLLPHFIVSLHQKDWLLARRGQLQEKLSEKSVVACRNSAEEGHLQTKRLLARFETWATGLQKLPFAGSFCDTTCNHAWVKPFALKKLEDSIIYTDLSCWNAKVRFSRRSWRKGSSLPNAWVWEDVGRLGREHIEHNASCNMKLMPESKLITCG